MAQDEKQDGRISPLEMILAVAGSAVGLGNFLRFPARAVANGGGAFMIPYFCALLFLGIPIGWAEWTMGRYGGRKGFHSAPAIMGVIGRGSFMRYVGVIGVLIPLGVYFYYVFIESWCLGYFWNYATGGIGVDPNAVMSTQIAQAKGFWENLIGMNADGALFSGGQGGVLVFWLITMVFNVWFLYRGLSKGIAKFCSYAMPAMAVIALIVLVRVMTLHPNDQHPDQGVESGLAYMWNPKWEALKLSKTWLEAAGQIFFSLSVGFGVIINYASYLKRKDDVVLSGLTASATNELFEVGFGGMITIPAAFIFLGATGIIGQGSFGLGFNTLPVVFAHMPGGNLIGALWFFMLFLAAITSSLSMLQPTVAFVEEALGCSRNKAITGVVLGSVLGGLFCLWYTGGGAGWGTIDNWVGTFLIVILAFFQIVCFGWCFGVDRGLTEAREGARMRIPSIMRFVMKYVAPLYLLVAIVMSCHDDLPGWWTQAMDPKAAGYSPAVGYSLLLIAATALVLVVITRIGAKRWRAQGLDLDGTRPPDDGPAVMTTSATTGGKR